MVSYQTIKHNTNVEEHLKWNKVDHQNHKKSTEFPPKWQVVCTKNIEYLEKKIEKTNKRIHTI
jgi:hypothetical protein